jgi:putative Mg2+ transporter-C (MgtC) family protein
MTAIGLEEMALRLGLATLLGMVLGFDREWRGHDAGLRTHALVALSSAMLTVSALLLFEELRAEGIQPDPLRAIQGIAQAIGFIAAGLIFVRGGGVKNLTTAANLWMAAAIGIVVGAGQYALVAVGTVLAFVILRLDSFLKQRARPDT